MAGHVEQGENVTHAAVREAREEAGIEIDPAELHFAHVMQRHNPDGTIYFDCYFRVTRWGGAIVNAEPHKCDDLRWFRRDGLPENTIDHVRQAIEAVFVRNAPFSTIGW